MDASDFNDSSLLVWEQKGLQFGNWTIGGHGDGSYFFSTKFKTSKV